MVVQSHFIGKFFQFTGLNDGPLSGVRFSLELHMLQISLAISHMLLHLMWIGSAQLQDFSSFYRQPPSCKEPTGYGPPKSTDTVCHSVSGISEGFTGSCLGSAVAILQ